MKWLGQHIVDFIARFRSDVYLEDLTTDSSTDILVVDSDGKICKNSGAGDDTRFTLTADTGVNQVIEDGNTLDIAGGNAISTVVSATDTVTINHSDTSTLVDIDNSGNTVIQDIGFDTYGHVTSLGTADIQSVESANTATSAESAGVATNVTASANNTADETVYPTFVDGATGTQGIETDTGLTYNPGTNILSSVNFEGALDGDASGSSGSCTGNAATATLASTTTITDKSDDVDYDVVFGNSTSALYDDTGTLTYNPNDAALSSTNFVGALTGNASGTALTVTAGNQASITTCGNLTTVGTITTGTWNAGIIAEGKLQNQSGTNTGDETLSSINGLAITTVGAIDTGTWAGGAITPTTVIASAYLDADTAHLTTDQTFTGTKTFSAATTTFTSATADSPIIKVLNTTDDNQAGQLIFEKLRDDDAVASGQNLGEIWFRGQNSAQESEDYAYIVGEIDVSTDGEESGILKLGVVNDDGGNGAGLILTGGSEDNEIDVTVGLGANSVVTIPGRVIAKQYRTINASFRDDIGTTKHYVPLKSQDEQTTLTREEGTELAVCDGRLVSATVRVENMQGTTGDFTLTMGVETNVVGAAYGTFGGTAETEAITVHTDDDNHVFHFVFNTAKHWDSTDMFAVSIESSSDEWGSNERFFVTLVIEDDWNTYLGGVAEGVSSSEIDSTP